MRAFLSFLLAFVLVPVFAAPTGPASPPPKDKPLTVPNHGDFVGVRVKAYEDKNAANVGYIHLLPIDHLAEPFLEKDHHSPWCCCQWATPRWKI